MNYGSVCSGIEAATEAWHQLGWKPAFYAEIDPAACAVLKHHHPDVPNRGDFTTIKGDEHGAIDLLVGGTPCQDFSVAGLRAGLDGKRGGLTIEFARLAHRMAARARTRWLVWENVPGVLSIDNGRAFAIFLSALSGRAVAVPRGGWKNSGIIEGTQSTFGLAYRVLDAQYAGVPQRRRRVFVVGYFGDWRRAAAVLFERHSLSGHPPPSREKGKGSARGIAVGPSGGEFTDTSCTLDSRAKDGAILNQLGMLVGDSRSVAEVAACLDASFGRLQGASGQDANHGHSHLVAFGGNNTRGPIEAATAVRAKGGTGHGDFESETFLVTSIQAGAVRENPESGPDGVGVRTDGAAYTLEARAEVQAVAYAVRTAQTSANGHGIAEDVAHTLDQAQGQAIAFSCKDHGADAGDTSPTLRAMGHDGSHANVYPPLSADADKGDQDAVVLAFRAAGQDGFRPSEISPPVAATDGGGAGAPTVAVSANQRGELREREVHGSLNGTKSGKQFDGIMQNMAVRRLTPKECARLQGFRDDYLDVLMRGKPLADGPKYKLLGNSMAVPCMVWLGERIQMVEDLTRK